MKRESDEKVYSGLRRFNLIMGGLHLIQGILMIVLSNDTTYPIFTNFLKFDRATFSLVPDPQLAYELRFGPAVALFLLISAVAHFCLATFGYKWYVKNLKLGMNPARFYEYALSSSLMIVLIVMVGWMYWRYRMALREQQQLAALEAETHADRVSATIGAYEEDAQPQEATPGVSGMANPSTDRARELPHT